MILSNGTKITGRLTPPEKAFEARMDTAGGRVCWPGPAQESSGAGAGVPSLVTVAVNGVFTLKRFPPPRLCSVCRNTAHHIPPLL